MIVFDLKCANGHVFETWIRDGKTCEVQTKAGEVECPLCGDYDVAKAVMAPNVAVAKGGDGALPDHAAQMMRQLRAIRDHVEKTCDDVGDRFPEEVRKIHYGETEKRNIFGEATGDDAQSLHEEGIEFGILPKLPRLDS